MGLGGDGLDAVDETERCFRFNAQSGAFVGHGVQKAMLGNTVRVAYTIVTPSGLSTGTTECSLICRVFLMDDAESFRAASTDYFGVVLAHDSGLLRFEPQ